MKGLLKKEIKILEPKTINWDEFGLTLKGILPFNYLEVYTNESNYVNEEFISKVKEIRFSLIQVRITDDCGSSAGYYDIEKLKVPTELKKTSKQLFHDKYIRYQKRDRKTFTRIIDYYKRVISKLVKSNSMFISNWFFTASDIAVRPLEKYEGRVFKRQADLPWFFEWVDEQDMMNHRFWSHGMWGIILPQEKKYKMAEWNKIMEYDQKDIQDFVRSIYGLLFLKYELDGIWLLVREKNKEEILDILNSNAL
ncbi:MAG: hypothetical protein US52_C0049G0005 [candidate division WS6 bacterium GW2011_GWA2_37_6]|uniref:Uncharacterized protein n=1 Tax=candidate division WS6 bacterium GW2011_GWA2_37_6 TaxID=1619087 RepID=A0A0G0GXG0_9BACT|nr:MAG: hypothetical protein US52_C0049G0005 [candidate division WS6 bacterium GW2011_GWA2_37_6]